MLLAVIDHLGRGESMESVRASPHACGSVGTGYDCAMDPMPRSIVLALAGIAIIGVAAAVIAYNLTPERPTPEQLAARARTLSDEMGLDRAETERLIAGCDGIKEGYSRLWSGLVSVRYEACLREAKLLN